MVSKQTGKVEKASSVTIAAGCVENAMLGFRERHAAATRPATPRKPWRARKDCHRYRGFRYYRCFHDLTVVLIGPGSRELAGYERQIGRDGRLRATRGLQGFQNPTTATTRVSVPLSFNRRFLFDSLNPLGFLDWASFMANSDTRGLNIFHGNFSVDMTSKTERGMNVKSAAGMY